MTHHLHWRYATKKFDPTKKISEEELHELLDSARLAPSSFGLQPWKFLVITDPALRLRLREHAWGQPQVTDASHLIILLAKKNVEEEYVHSFVEETAKARQKSIESLNRYEDVMNRFLKNMTSEEQITWAKKQVYIAIGFLMYDAAYRKIDSCPMEGFDAQAFDEILELKDYTTTVLLPVGYRADDDIYATTPKVRFKTKEVVERR